MRLAACGGRLASIKVARPQNSRVTGIARSPVRQECSRGGGLRPRPIWGQGEHVVSTLPRPLVVAANMRVGEAVPAAAGNDLRVGHRARVHRGVDSASRSEASTRVAAWSKLPSDSEASSSGASGLSRRRESPLTEWARSRIRITRSAGSATQPRERSSTAVTGPNHNRDRSTSARVRQNRSAYVYRYLTDYQEHLLSLRRLRLDMT